MKHIACISSVLIVCLFFCGCTSINHDTDLESRVEALEVRVAKLETSMVANAAKANARKIVNAQRIKAHQRMRRDLSIYSKDQLKEIETLYRTDSRIRGSEKRIESLKKIVSDYGKSNRAGCAILYLGQMSNAKAREQYLQQAINDFSDCYYGNGVQVGAYARYLLALYYESNSRKDKARELFSELVHKYPGAIDHRGRLLSDIIKPHMQ